MQMHAVTIISPYVYKSKLPQLWLHVSTLDDDDDDSAMHNLKVCVSVYSPQNNKATRFKRKVCRGYEKEMCIFTVN